MTINFQINTFGFDLSAKCRDCVGSTEKLFNLILIRRNRCMSFYVVNVTYADILQLKFFFSRCSRGRIYVVVIVRDCLGIPQLRGEAVISSSLSLRCCDPQITIQLPPVASNCQKLTGIISVTLGLNTKTLFNIYIHYYKTF